MRELRLARRPGEAGPGLAEPGLSEAESRAEVPRQHLWSCEHRSVSKDGRIICQKIVDGDPEVSPNVCRDCPYLTVNCSHLRFSLRLSSPSPLVVRFNGRTEVWDDGPARLTFERAACAERVIPIHGPRACAECPLRQPLPDAAAEPPARRPAAAAGKVVSFPAREPVAATG
ncbi:MAG: hypothetical protein P8129_13145 [Anaerolineae bacterium]